MSRVSDFNAYLLANAIPVDGVSGNPPFSDTTVSVQFSSSATPEQVAWATQAKQVFDWRERRALTRNQVVTNLRGLTTNQQNTILLQMIAAYILANSSEAIKALSDTGIPLPIDEVKPVSP